ncbi:MAG: PA2779 family protein [Proteobacteria bacterium]|nr:PA2779 family protein [Pseudomonadota bacterium]
MQKFISVIAIIGFLGASLVPPSAQAGVITTEDYVQQVDADAQREQVAEMLQREDVRERMLAMGVDPAHVEARLGALSDAEVAKLADGIDNLPAGAGVAGALLFVVLVFVILDIVGVTDVFPFINSVD